MKKMRMIKRISGIEKIKRYFSVVALAIGLGAGYIAGTTVQTVQGIKSDQVISELEQRISETEKRLAEDEDILVTELNNGNIPRLGLKNGDVLRLNRYGNILVNNNALGPMNPDRKVIPYSKAALDVFFHNKK